MEGRVVEVRNWLSEGVVAGLRADVASLEARGQFRPSGLSVTSGEENADRRTGESSSGEERLCCVVGVEESAAAAAAIVAVLRELEAVRRAVEGSTGRRLRLGEMYYSITRPGARLSLHTDERHEETKGDEGWREASRLSVAWLVYLSDADVRGGEFRAYCREAAVAPVGSHGGDVQVGWLDIIDPSTTTMTTMTAVFLDAWLPPTGVLSSSSSSSSGGGRLMPLCGLYSIDAAGRRRDLGSPIAASDPDLSGAGMSTAGFSEALRRRLPAHLRLRFAAVATPGPAVVDVRPAPGTLVIFDAVAVPHEVLEVKSGTRRALAGWFHKELQQPPAWFLDAIASHDADGAHE